ncbi:Helix-turn-helix domain-containing protein, partial [Dysosmobacter welbionis]
GAGHGQTQVGVNVDLAHGATGSLAQLFLGNAHGIRHLTAEFVDHTDELLGHGRGAMKHNGESGQALHDLV